MSTHLYFMQIALQQAMQAAAMGEVPVGAVIVKDQQIIALAHNQPITLHDPSAHAEIQVIRRAAQQLGNYRLVDCSLYVTLEPCLMCAGAIQHARIAHLIYGASDAKTGACGSVLDVMQETQLNHHTTVTGGIMAAQCGELLSQFFQQRRAAQHSSAK